MLASVVSNGSAWNYGYNNRRLPIAETLSFPGGGGWEILRWYNPNGHQSQIRYPDWTVVTHEPNALGEVTLKVNFGSKEIVTGKGTGTDIVETSARAYLNAVNRFFGSGGDKSHDAQP